MTISIRAKQAAPEGSADIELHKEAGGGVAEAASSGPNAGSPGGEGHPMPEKLPLTCADGPRPSLPEPLPSAFSPAARASLRASIESARRSATDDIPLVLSMLFALSTAALDDWRAPIGVDELAALRGASRRLAAALAAGRFPIGGSTMPAKGGDGISAAQAHEAVCAEIITGAAALYLSDADVGHRRNRST